MTGFSDEEKLMLYGAYGGTPLYLQQINEKESFEENIKRAYLKVTSYLYEEALLLLRQEVQEPGVYSAIIEEIFRRVIIKSYRQSMATAGCFSEHEKEKS